MVATGNLLQLTGWPEFSQGSCLQLGLRSPQPQPACYTQSFHMLKLPGPPKVVALQGFAEVSLHTPIRSFCFVLGFPRRVWGLQKSFSTDGLQAHPELSLYASIPDMKTPRNSSKVKNLLCIYMEMSTPRLQQKQTYLGWVHCIPVQKQFARVCYKGSEVLGRLIWMPFPWMRLRDVAVWVVLRCELLEGKAECFGEKHSVLAWDFSSAEHVVCYKANGQHLRAFRWCIYRAAAINMKVIAHPSSTSKGSGRVRGSSGRILF